LLDLTNSVDHEVVDGAPVVRFARRLAELVEQADGLAGGFADPHTIVRVHPLWMDTDGVCADSVVLATGYR